MTGMVQYGSGATMGDVIKHRRQDVAVVNGLDASKLPGRIQTNKRAIPSSATDVLSSDREGDFMVDVNYSYLLLLTPSGLRWDRQSLNVGW